MNVVDSCGWLEYFTDGPNADFFAPIIEDTATLLVPSICLVEVFKKILQERNEEKALTIIAAMQQAEIIDLDVTLSLNSAKIGLEYSLPLADSIITATAIAYQAMIWTEDEHFKDIPGVKYIEKK